MQLGWVQYDLKDRTSRENTSSEENVHTAPKHKERKKRLNDTDSLQNRV
jgi:hypothetical protein